MKRPFLLLEVLIAMTLLLVALAPMARTQVALYQVERDRMRSLQLRQISDEAFTVVVEKLYRQLPLDWTAVEAKEKQQLVFPKELQEQLKQLGVTAMLNLDPKRVKWAWEKKSQQFFLCVLGQVDIEFKNRANQKQTFHYPLFFRRKATAEEIEEHTKQQVSDEST